MQIEGIGIVKNSKNRKEAELFIDFILEDQIQNIIPLTNWMYPVNTNLKLPESFEYAPKPGVTLIIDSGKINLQLSDWIEEWTSAVTD